jgi:hypothetical protein
MTDLTITDAGYLADIMRGVESNAKLRWYPAGTADNPMKCRMRAFTHEGGGFWFDSDGDIQDAYIWTSGVFEHWIRVRDLIAALHNMMHGTDLSAPLAAIDTD